MNSAAWKLLALLLAVALATRLAVGFYWQSRLDGRFGFGDSDSYWALGRTIATGRPYEFGQPKAKIFRTPGYPAILAPIFFGGDEPSVMWARAQSAVLGTLTVGGVWWLARRLFDARAALIAAAIAAFYPGAIATSVLVLSEAPFCLLMLVQFALWTAACSGGSTRRTVAAALGAGLVAAAATLVRPSWLLFTPLAVVVGLVMGRRCEPAGLSRDVRVTTKRAAQRGDEPRGSLGTCSLLGAARCRHLWVGVLMLLGLVAAMSPWWIRNARLTGRFVPTTLQVGASLYDGLSPNATGASDMAFVAEFVAAEDEDKVENGFELQLDRRFRTEALAWARANPGRAAELAAIKLGRMWNIWPNEPALSSWPIRLAVLLSYLPVMVLAIIGAARTIRWGWPYILCWLPALYFTALHVVFVSSIRYRQPAMLGLIVLAAGVLGSRKTGKGGGD